MTTISGSCLCGRIRYEGDAQPVFMGNCHCIDCRKSSAGGTVTHHFCPNCGSQMYNKSSNMPGVTVIVASTLDNPRVFTPQVSVYTKRALDWDKPVEGSMQFEELPPRGQ